jgi:endonuclease-3
LARTASSAAVRANGEEARMAAEEEAIQPSERVRWVYERLVEQWGIPPWQPDGDALGGLIATILSQHTSDLNSERAYARLRQAFPTWADVRDAPVDVVADAIRVGGLAQVKAERIQRVLRAISEQRDGALDLGYLAALPLDDALADLRALPGVGPKTAACVLLFSLGRPAFPVDTHVWRVTRRFGLIGPKVTPEVAHRELEEQIPAEWRHTLHVNLIQHGRRICHAQRPACDRCVLAERCEYTQSRRKEA